VLTYSSSSFILRNHRLLVVCHHHHLCLTSSPANASYNNHSQEAVPAERSATRKKERKKERKEEKTIYMMPDETKYQDENPEYSDGMKEMFRRASKFETEENRLRGLNYRPRENDVAITTSPKVSSQIDWYCFHVLRQGRALILAPVSYFFLAFHTTAGFLLLLVKNKCGTTWMQQICHQLRSADAGGDMNFEEISEVVPWLEMAYDQQQDLEAPQYGAVDGKPRFFKTHAWYDHCPKFERTIVVLRNPFDVCLSFYRFFEDWFFDAGTVSIEEFSHWWMNRGVPQSRMSNASYFVHLVSWYEHRNDKSKVLFVFFEDLKDDLEGQIRRIAKFISNEKHNFNQDEYIRVAKEKSSYEYMRKHSYHFDEKLSRRHRNGAMGLPIDAGGSAKVAKGGVGAGRVELTHDVKAQIQQKWEEIAPVTKCKTYEALRQQFHEEVFRSEKS